MGSEDSNPMEHMTKKIFGKFNLAGCRECHSCKSGEIWKGVYYE